MPRCKALLPSPKRLHAGRRNPESGVATNKERHLATTTSRWVGCRRIRGYAAMTKDEGNAADGRFSKAS